MPEIQQIIEGLNCFKSHQHKCAECPWNPRPGMLYPYGCIKGQIDIAEAAQELLREKSCAVGSEAKCSDAISRSALLASYDAAHKGPPGGARKLIEDAPTLDVMSVVRCKDCTHCAIWEDGKGFTCEYNEMEYYAPHYSAETYFCGNAVRKEEEEHENHA